MANIPSKCILIIIDGLGDLPIPAFSGSTPLEAAITPNMDLMASGGLYGLTDPIGMGVIPNTHSGVGLLLGVAADDIARMSRGPVEAAGAGRTLLPGEVAVRANFATVETLADGLLVTDRRAGRIRRGTDQLAAVLRQVDLGDGVLAEFFATEQHRGVVVLSGNGLDDAISDTDPGDANQPNPLLRCRPLHPGAARTAQKLNAFIDFAHQRLQHHPLNEVRLAAGLKPANAVITRGAGAPFVPANRIARLGLPTAVVAGCNTVRGLGRISGFSVITDERFTADTVTDLDAKIETALSALRVHDLVYVHIKAPDICAHDIQPEAKRDFLERLDAAMAPLLQQHVVTAVSADHTTDSNTGTHTADPVPTLLYWPGRVHGNHRVKFGETVCRQGNLKRCSNSAFLQRVLDSIGVSEPAEA